MSNPFLAEIRIFTGNFAPKGWALCDGQILSISQNTALFSLLGTTYGGNGQTNFALPDLQGRVPISSGNGHTLGERGGEAAHTVSISELPTHPHQASASANPASTNTPTNSLVLAASTASQLYGPPADLVAMAPNSLGNIGGSQAHPNLQP